MRIQKFFWQLLLKLEDHFFRNEKAFGNKNFCKERYCSSEQNILAQFFSYYRASKKSSNNLYKLTKYFDDFCLNRKIISLGRRCRWKQYFLRKNECYNSSEKILRPIFSSNNLYEKLGATNFDGLSSNLSFIVEVILPLP